MIDTVVERHSVEPAKCCSVGLGTYWVLEYWPSIEIDRDPMPKQGHSIDILEVGEVGPEIEEVDPGGRFAVEQDKVDDQTSPAGEDIEVAVETVPDLEVAFFDLDDNHLADLHHFADALVTDNHPGVAVA